MAKNKHDSTPENVHKATYHIAKQLLGIVKNQKGIVGGRPPATPQQIVLTVAQAKRLFKALHTVTIYLHQPTNVRQIQVERIISVRDELESEFETQIGTTIE